MTSGAEAVVYNLPGIASGAIKLDGPTLADIYLGNIKKWDDAKIKALNSGVSLPSADIAVAHRSDGSGTTFIFTNYLSKVSPEWSTKVGFATSVNWPGGVGGQGNEGVAGVVKQTPGAIGYVELAYAKQTGLAWVQLKNKAGNFVQPTLEGTTAAAENVTLPDDMKYLLTDSPNAKAYPISRIYLGAGLREPARRRQGQGAGTLHVVGYSRGPEAGRVAYLRPPRRRRHQEGRGADHAAAVRRQALPVQVTTLAILGRR